MTDTSVRLARADDIEQLVEMRRDFTFEDLEAGEATGRPDYEDDCSTFLASAIVSGRWQPDFRGQGIGAEIIGRAQEAARQADVELIIVWPSEESLGFYKREGFAGSDEPLIWKADPPRV
jgi:GNAT superfamily N-acetyltransferase